MRGNNHVRFLGEGVTAMSLPYPTKNSLPGCFRNVSFWPLDLCGFVQLLRNFCGYFAAGDSALASSGRSFCREFGQGLLKAACRTVGMRIKTRLDSLPMKLTPVSVQRTERTIEPVRTKRCGWGGGGNRARSEHGFNRLGAPPDRLGLHAVLSLHGSEERRSRAVSAPPSRWDLMVTTFTSHCRVLERPISV